MRTGVFAAFAVVVLAVCASASATPRRVLVLSGFGEPLSPGSKIQWYAGLGGPAKLEGPRRTLDCVHETNGFGTVVSNSQPVDELAISSLTVTIACGALEETGHDLAYVEAHEVPVKLAAHGPSRIGLAAQPPTLEFEDGCDYTAPKLRLTASIVPNVDLVVSGEFRRTMSSPRSCERSWRLAGGGGYLEVGFVLLVEAAVEMDRPHDAPMMLR